jgi:hypothetical protein
MNLKPPLKLGAYTSKQLACQPEAKQFKGKQQQKQNNVTYSLFTKIPLM